jgi:hypothetical protein
VTAGAAGSAPAASAPAAVAASAPAGAAASAPAAVAASVSAGTFGMKLLALGVLLGAASTALGVLLAVAVVTPEGTRGPEERARVSGASTGNVAGGAVQAANTPGRVIASGVRLAPPATRLRAEASVSPEAGAAPSALAGPREGPGAISEARASAKAARATSDLDEEARLVTAARSALLSGDPARALALVQTTRKLSARALEPEELGLEARALHALGRSDEAAATELVLRQRHPDHALAR